MYSVVLYQQQASTIANTVIVPCCLLHNQQRVVCKQSPCPGIYNSPTYTYLDSCTYTELHLQDYFVAIPDVLVRSPNA